MLAVTPSLVALRLRKVSYRAVKYGADLRFSQHAHQLLQTRQVMHGQEVVHMGQGGLDAAHQRLVVRRPQ